MKNRLKILILLFILSTGCATGSFFVHEEDINAGMKPFMERTEKEDKFSISIPVYTF